MTARSLKVGLLGCGTVGSSVARIITDQADELSARIGCDLTLSGVAVSDITKKREGVDSQLLHDDAELMLKECDFDIVVELIGGIEPARTLIMAAIEKGASIVTANKALLAAHGREILRAAHQAGVEIYYEAAVGGAIPIIRPLRESLVGDEVTAVMGIVNGTTNYILDKMSREGMGYSDAVVQAQQLGYAEADPTADVEGYDAAAKAALLASLAFHTWVPGDRVERCGITEIELADIKAAQDLGYVIKLIAKATVEKDGSIEVAVHPTMVKCDHPLANVNGADNAIVVEAQAAGRLMFQGPGAGGAPTASAVVGDIVTVARHRHAQMAPTIQSMYADHELKDRGETFSRYFLRFEVSDEPGVLSTIAGILSEHGISIETARQFATAGEQGAHAQLQLMTHRALTRDLARCCECLENCSQVHGKIHSMRVEGV